MAETTETQTVPKTRDSIRAGILGKTRRPLFKLVDFFGEEVEVRQPTLGGILDAQENEDRQRSIIQLLIERVYVPGTDIHIFEDTDVDQLREMPFGADFARVQEAMTELSGVNFPKPNSGSEDRPPA